MKHTATMIILALLVSACERTTESSDTGTGDSETMHAQDQTQASPGGKPAEPRPPVAEKRPRELTAHGETRVDEYYWLRDDERENPDVLAYLEAENAYLDQAMAHTQAMQERLFAELSARVKPDDTTIPARSGDWWYFAEYASGKDYPIFKRSRRADGGDGEVLLDANERARNSEYYDVTGQAVSPDGRLWAWAEDTVGRGNNDIHVLDTQSGEIIDTGIGHVVGALAWGNDNKTLFYVRRQEGTLIPFQVWRHEMGGDGEDVLVYEESDPQFVTWVYKSRDGRNIMIYSGQTTMTEMRRIDADTPTVEPEVLLARQRDHEYFVDPLGEVAYIRSNLDAPNFRLMRAPLDAVGDTSAWREVLPHREDFFLNDMAVFDGFLAVEEMRAGTTQLRMIPLDGAEPWVIEADEPAYVAGIDDNPNTDADFLRFSYSSLATPDTIYDYDFASRERTLRKQEFAGPDFSRDNYEVHREWITARDGTEVPVTLLTGSGVEPNGSHPLYVLGYGSYGSTYDPDFRDDRLSLVDRGFVFALAHIRGGQEMGRQWYDQGRLLNKKNTFHDFIDVTRGLVERGWGHPDKVVGAGRSAGGLLIGAVANMAPETFTILTTEVPFVDVVTTMLDESIPLTTFEYDEWGNPNEREYYDYMLSYSPYDQVSAQEYPHMLVSTGLWDPAVQYWEPAKWVARLRDRKTDDHRLLMHTNMNAGHRGSAGRFERLKDRAREYAFIFDILKIEA